MAEALLVMIVMGVVGAIALTSLKPQNMKDEAMEALAQKMLADIDEATTAILLNNSPNGYVDNLYIPGSTTNTFRFSSNCGYVAQLYKKYLTPIRKTYTNPSGEKKWMNTGIVYSSYFYLKNGGFVSFSCAIDGEYTTFFPGETDQIKIANSFYGRIMYDVNAEEPPNLIGKDIFAIPIGKKGILYK